MKRVRHKKIIDGILLLLGKKTTLLEEQKLNLQLGYPYINLQLPRNYAIPFGLMRQYDDLEFLTSRCLTATASTPQINGDDGQTR